jgi:predicted RNA binding protein YcfA (HicA-like mRNA interferase family)
MALERAGFVFRRQTGSHMILRRGDPYARVVVPDHRQVRQGTLRRIIADAGLTVDEFTVDRTNNAFRYARKDMVTGAEPPGRKSSSSR